MQDRIEAFLHYLSAERGASKNTIDAYRNDLGGFRKFIDAGGAAPAPLASGDDSSEDGAGTAGGTGSESPIAQVVTPQTITGYIGDLNDRRYAKATVARKVAAVKSFCAFLLDSGDLQSNPATQVDSPRAPKPVPKPMTTAEVDSLLQEPRKYDSPEACRDAAMLELMYGTGMRVTELVSLNVDAVRIDEPSNPWVRCLGKGGKERDMEIPANALDALVTYLNDARPLLLKARPHQALFVNRRGERLTRQGFWLILKGYAKSAGIDGHVTPHTLRHSFATHLLRAGHSVLDVQQRLGHANVSTTQVYTQLTDGHLQEVYRDAHPRSGGSTNGPTPIGD